MGDVGYILGTGSRHSPLWLKGVVRAKMRGLVAGARANTQGRVNGFEIILGDAPGVDREIRDWVIEQQDPLVRLHEGTPFKATWDADCDERCAPDHRKERPDGTTFCPAQGPYRNGRMVGIAKGHHEAGNWVRVAAFYAEPKSKGTADCVKQAEAAGLIVRKFGNAPETAEERKAVRSLRP